MARHVFVVMTRPTAGQDAEFNRWYDEQHVPDVLRVPGFVGCRRFSLGVGQDPNAFSYLALYDMETDDPAAVLAELNKRAGTPQMPLSPALDVTTVSATLYTARS